ncbi:hypothetical protein RI129_006791 [Pyrocoelia pectoralis]|uniref:Mitochondria-eating protein n=1 Tax=Pyrocoelia pectoralis TaxID=417401 RepID=A0AAN7VH03_9COLE
MRECGERIRRERAAPLSPKLALRRVLVLAEGRQFREAASILAKLGPTALNTVANELPLELLVDGLPHSAQLLETLFNRLLSSNPCPNMNTEPVIWQLVRLLASHEDSGLKAKIRKLAQILGEYQPDIRRLLVTKRKAFEEAVKGLGCHGLTPDVSGLTHLHVALKNEITSHIEAYKTVLHKLDDLGLVTNDSKKPVDASHHRLLSLQFEDVQQRLIDNTTLLTILDKPALKQLKILIETLSKRVQSDKEALFCISQLKRLQPIDENKPVATLLMTFTKGCGALLDLMQVSESPCHSDGYHSESEQEVDKRNDATDRYAALYYQNRPRALEALDSLPELQHATQLKAKILFSVVVLAFRTCKNLRESKLRESLRSLHVDERTSAAHIFRTHLMRCLASTAETFPLVDAERQVLALLCDTLKEYECLKTCAPLRAYVSNVTSVCWYIANQDPPYELDTDFQIPVRFQPERHLKHHSSDRLSNTVRAYLWPGLLSRSSFAHKAVVITNGT